MDITSALAALDLISQTAKAISKDYGFIHKQAFIKYRGKEGRLVWDFILLNELTFEDSTTGEQYSLGISASDKKTEALFNELVSRFGI